MSASARHAEPDLLRIEVTDQYGTATETVDPASLQALSRRQQVRLRRVARDLIDGIAQVRGCDQDYASGIAVAELMRLLADSEAYDREAERRGVLF